MGGATDSWNYDDDDDYGVVAEPGDGFVVWLAIGLVLAIVAAVVLVKLAIQAL